MSLNFDQKPATELHSEQPWQYKVEVHQKIRRGSNVRQGNLNRASRRAKERSGKRGKQTMTALGVLASSTLLASNFSLIQSEQALAVTPNPAPTFCTNGGTPEVPQPGTTLTDAGFTIDASGSATADVNAIRDANVALGAIAAGTGRCVTIEITGDSTLDFWDGAEGATLNLSQVGVDYRIVATGSTLNGHGKTQLVSSVDDLWIVGGTYKNGYASLGSTVGVRSENGGAIDVYGNLILQGASFEDNFAEHYGGAINSWVHTYVSGDNTFTGNGRKPGMLTSLTAGTESGGAIYSFGDTFIIDGTNSFSGNRALYGGAISNGARIGGDTVEISGGTNYFTNNVAYDGGAIYSEYSFGIYGGTNTFTGNKAEDGGAIFSNYNISVEGGTNRFETNKAESQGRRVLEVAVATTDTIEDLSAGTVVYANGTSGEGATLTTSGTLTAIDGYFLTVGDRILVKNETSKAHNGIYVYTSSTVLTRATDYDTEIARGDFVNVAEGNTKSGTGWRQTDPVDVVGTDAIDWEEYGQLSPDFQGGAFYSEYVDIYGDINSFSTNSAVLGGAIFADYADVENTLFTSNSATTAGGAIHAVFAEGYVSVFTGNNSPEGSAIFVEDRLVNSYAGVVALFSTFNSNVGTPIHMSETGEGYIGVLSSTFDSNTATLGPTAIYSSSPSSGSFFGGNMVAFSTFVGSGLGNSGFLDLSGQSLVRGNIFADLTETNSRAISIGEGGDLLNEFNIFTSASQNAIFSSGASVSGDSSTFGAAFSDLYLGNLSPATASFDEDGDLVTPTRPITDARSVAVEFVPWPWEVEGGLFGGIPDQLFKSRSSMGLDSNNDPLFRGLTTAGAVHFAGRRFETETRPPVVSSPVAIKFNVDNLSTIRTSPGGIVRAAGVGLTSVTQITVNGVVAEILYQDYVTIRFRVPAGLSGKVDVRFIGDNQTQLLSKSLNIAAATSINKRVVVPGFAANSKTLTRAMKNQIRQFIKDNPGVTSVTCKGFTSSPATRGDQALARARGKAACDLIRRINPDIKIKVAGGSHTPKPGTNVRRVVITVNK